MILINLSFRHALTGLKLRSFSLAECAQTILKERIEILDPGALRIIWRSMCEGSTQGVYLTDRSYELSSVHYICRATECTSHKMCMRLTLSTFST